MILIQELTDVCRERETDLRIVPEIMQLNIRQVQVENLDGIPLLGIGAHRSMSRANQLLKRSIDILVVILGLPLWAPISLLVALALMLEGDGPVIYRQDARRQGQPPVRNAEVPQHGGECGSACMRRCCANRAKIRAIPKFVDDPRVTRVGKILASHQPRRIAKSNQCHAGRDEPGRPAAAHAQVKWNYTKRAIRGVCRSRRV